MPVRGSILLITSDWIELRYIRVVVPMIPVITTEKIRILSVKVKRDRIENLESDSDTLVSSIF